MKNGPDTCRVLTIPVGEEKELLKIAQSLFWSAKTPRDEKVAVLLMKILGAGPQQQPHKEPAP